MSLYVDHTPAPRIRPVAAAVDRPFWSVMIPTYNCARFLREALNGVLSNRLGPEEMDIEVVDDCSRDDPEAVVREVGQGRVKFYRQPRKQGPNANLNACIARARGKWVHILQGDDTVLPGFYEHARTAIDRCPLLGAVIFRAIYVDENSLWSHFSAVEAPSVSILAQDFTERMLLGNRVILSAMVVRRSVYEDLGGLRPELVHSADWDLGVRIALGRAMMYDPEPLVCHRLHRGSLSARLIRIGENVADERRFVNILGSYVPKDCARDVQRAVMRAIALRAVTRGQYLWRHGQHEAARAQLREALRCSIAPGVIGCLLRVSPWLADPASAPATSAVLRHDEGRSALRQV